ncbi:CE1759 family FMN reductase [Trueperella pyogenes]|uniref:CE1759 family FMN reductase n=1 Tax=Trueperella pyogenes TaxID=1661 RepID=UPI000E024F6D|nr:CE1759 family FMN reductase [Trueperella pyogenes]SUO87696.1 FMN reductase (NADPH) [Trueperella pyogenes]
MRVVVVSASLSESSMTNQLGRAMADACVAEFGGEVQVISLREFAHAITDNMLTGFPSPALEAAFEQVKAADAVIAVTPTYNASYSGLFKSFFDVLPENYLKDKPVAIGATGGTPRHSLVTEHALRPMLTYLHAHAVPTAIYVATEDFGAHASDSTGADGANLARRIRRAARELAALHQMSDPAAGVQEPERGVAFDDVAQAKAIFEDFTPMADLLG